MPTMEPRTMLHLDRVLISVSVPLLLFSVVCSSFSTHPPHIIYKASSMIRQQQSNYFSQKRMHKSTPLLPLHAGGTFGNAAVSRGDKIKKKLLARDGEHFKIDRLRGTVELGCTGGLVTTDDEWDKESLSEWLKDDRGLALSLWEKDLMTDLGNSVYRLQLVSLKFLTFSLAPSVDALMYTELLPPTTTNGGSSSAAPSSSSSSPLFTLQSVAFDPNIKFLPGRLGEVSAESLGVEINVVGTLRVSDDGKSLLGRFGFQTDGKLPAPVRLLPDAAVRAASTLFNRQIANFAVSSFKKNAVSQYNKYRLSSSSSSSSDRDVLIESGR